MMYAAIPPITHRVCLIRLRSVCLASLILLLHFSVMAQGTNAGRRMTAGIGEIVTAIDSFNSRLPEEQLFLHVDKPYYTIGDTLWFKAYLFQGMTHAYSSRSGLLYIELINDSSRQVKRISVPVRFGLSWGQIALDGNAFSAGSYTLRAYTQWMENFDEATFFHQSIFIAPATLSEWQARLHGSAVGRGVATAGTGSMTGQGMNAGAGAKTVGGAVVNGTVKEGKGSRSIDVQFMPEGGWLVAGLPARVGFKAIGKDGLGRNVQGVIVNNQGDTISTFQSLYKGMGVVDLPVLSEENYTALIFLPDGSLARFALPAVRRSGYVLRVDNKRGADSLKVSILASPDLVDGRTLRLVGLGRGIVCFGANLRLNKGTVYGVAPKAAFPSGVAHFTLFNEANEPLCERITYIDHQDALNVQLTTDKDHYLTRDSIPLQIHATDAQGQPLAGSFSLAVTDDGQVHADHNEAENIVSRMLLTASLKGYVETPFWYLSTPTEEAWRALDALLLTQGWKGYQWKHIFSAPHPPLYAAEPVFSVTGTVTNLLNKPIQNAKVSLISLGGPELAMDTITGADGRFVFDRFPAFDSTGFFLQARNAKGNSFGLGLTVDAFNPPALSGVPDHSILQGDDPATDNALSRYVQYNEAVQDAKDPYGRRYKTLQRVVVRATPGVRGSHNLNGAGQADQVVDEETILKAGKVTLKALLLQYVKGFRITYSKTGIEEYFLYQDHIRLVVDGLYVSRFGIGQERETLDALDAEDIVGVEVMRTPRNTAGYNSTFLSARQLMSPGREMAFIEITTRSGNGLFMKKTPGVTTYRPMAISWPHTFYSPRYPVRQTAGGQDGHPTDLRATVYWQPSVVTNKEGKAFSSFYAADTPGSYTIIIQGSDMDGNVGFGIKQLSITR